jgi:hypothetical protein
MKVDPSVFASVLADVVAFGYMSARDIIEQLPALTPAELRVIERRITELMSQAMNTSDRATNGRSLRAERIEGRLVLTGTEIVRQAEVDAILNEFP